MATKAKKAPTDIMGFMNLYLVDKAPVQLPKNVKEWLVKYMPWGILIILVLTAPLVLAVLGISAVVLPFSNLTDTAVAGGLTLAMILLIVREGLLLAALPWLFNRKKQGWLVLFYAEVLVLVQSIITGAILTGVISAIVVLYFLFQIRSYYR